MSKERSTLPRQWALLNSLPVYPKKVAIRQLWTDMEDLGYKVTKRTVERDLINLSLQFPIVSDDAKPAGWSIRSDQARQSKTLDRLLPDIKPFNHSARQSSVAESTTSKNDDDTPELASLNKRFDPFGFLSPREHHPADFVGRQWLLDRIDEWLGSQHASLLWLQGEPGVGKTAFMSWLSQQRKSEVVAAYFCQFQFQKSPEAIARDAIISLAVQLARRVPAYRKLLIGHEDLDRTALENLTADELFDCLIIQPLTVIGSAKVTSDEERRLVILIDGLDEAGQYGSRNVLLDCLLKYRDLLPASLAIIFSSRNEAALSYRMTGIESISLAADAYENKQDLCLWLDQYIPTSLSDQRRVFITDAFMHNSEGLFLYLRLLQPNMPQYLENPEHTPVGLDSFFMDSFGRYFPDIERYAVEQRPFLELLVSALEPVSQSTVCTVLGWDDDRCDSVMASFGALFSTETLACLPNETGSDYLYFDDSTDIPRKLMPFHKALMDWLTDGARAGLYRVLPQRGQQRWADRLWTLYCDNISALSDYALCYLPRHLALAGRHDDARTCLLNFEFILTRFSELSLPDDLYTLIEEYQQAHDQLPMDETLLAWAHFYRANGHYLQKGHPGWSTARILIQRAAEQPLGSAIRALADDYIEHKQQGYWLRSMLPGADSHCQVLDNHYKGFEPLVMADDRIVGVTQTGEIHVWDGNTGQRLLSLPGVAKVQGVLAINGSHIVTWHQGEQPCLCLWDIRQEECLLTVAHHGTIQHVCKLDDQRFVASFEHFFMGAWNIDGQPCFANEQLTHFIGHIWPLSNGHFLTDTDNRCNGEAENVLSLWHGQSGALISQLRSYQAHEKIQLSLLPDGGFLTHSQDSETFQIWASADGQLLATSNKQAGRPLCVLKDLPVRIMLAYDPDNADWRCLLNLRTWAWKGGSLALVHNVNLIADEQLDLGFDEKSACICDCQLFDDGRVLLPSPLSLWSGLSGDQIADLQGSWSLGVDISDFGSFYRRFQDGCVLTWSEQDWADSSSATDLYLWDIHGHLIRQIKIDSLFFDVRIVNQRFFVSFNCDDTLQVWDAKTGDLRQTIVGTGGKMVGAQLLPNLKLLTWDHANHLTLWPLAAAMRAIDQRHASDGKVQALMIKDRILSYSLDAFPPKLWDANTGDLVAVLPAYDSAVGARLAGVLALSGQRFLTWGYAPVIHIYDSQQGQCLASLQKIENPHIGFSRVWPLQQDQILCLLWDGSLRVYDLQENHFDAHQLITHHAKVAYPVSAERILYLCENDSLRLWNVAKKRHNFDLLGHAPNITDCHTLSNQRLVVLSKKENPLLLDLQTGKSVALDWSHSARATAVTELNDGRIAVWSNTCVQIWDVSASPSLNIELLFEKPDQLVCVTQLPDGHFLTQLQNNRATLWSVWHADTGELLGSTIMSSEYGLCTEVHCVDQSVFLRLVHAALQMDGYVLLDWQNPDQLQYIPLNAPKNSADTLAFNLFIRSLSREKGAWFYWHHATGSPVGLARINAPDIQCEWHGEPMHQFLGLTDDGRLLGFGRRPILLQLYQAGRPVSF